MSSVSSTIPDRKFLLPFVSRYDFLGVADRFDNQVLDTTNKWTSIASGSGTVAIATSGGRNVVSCNTGTSLGSNAGLKPKLKIGLDGYSGTEAIAGMDIDVIIKFSHAWDNGVITDTTTTRLAISNSGSSMTQNDIIGIRNDAGVPTFVTDASGVETTTDISADWTETTWSWIKIRVLKNQAILYINGSEVANHITNVPTASVRDITAMINNSSTTATSFDIDYFAVTPLKSVIA